jgi:hypothetical protein
MDPPPPSIQPFGTEVHQTRQSTGDLKAIAYCLLQAVLNCLHMELLCLKFGVEELGNIEVDPIETHYLIN